MKIIFVVFVIILGLSASSDAAQLAKIGDLFRFVDTNGLLQLETLGSDILDATVTLSEILEISGQESVGEDGPDPSRIVQRTLSDEWTFNTNPVAELAPYFLGFTEAFNVEASVPTNTSGNATVRVQGSRNDQNEAVTLTVGPLKDNSTECANNSLCFDVQLIPGALKFDYQFEWSQSSGDQLVFVFDVTWDIDTSQIIRKLFTGGIPDVSAEGIEDDNGKTIGFEVAIGGTFFAISFPGGLLIQDEDGNIVDVEDFEFEHKTIESGSTGSAKLYVIAPIFSKASLDPVAEYDPDSAATLISWISLLSSLLTWFGLF